MLAETTRPSIDEVRDLKKRTDDHNRRSGKDLLD